MGQIYNHVCLNCKNVFQSINKDAKYCSHNCFSIHRKGRWANPRRMEREIRQCKTCQKEFICRINKDKKYCSYKCYWADLKGSVYPKLRTGRKYFCKICYKSFYRSKKSTQKYCSRDCYLIDHSKNMKKVECAICGTLFEVSRKTKDGRLFCSRECYLEDHSKIIEKRECLNAIKFLNKV